MEHDDLIELKKCLDFLINSLPADKEAIMYGKRIDGEPFTIVVARGRSADNLSTFISMFSHNAHDDNTVVN